jgi:sugar O-acyltransferase (sialic acid O-acetyltransferase NeuD family)
VKQIALVGGGALGQQILGLFFATKPRQPVLFFDDPLHANGVENTFPFDAFLDKRFADCDFHVCLGYHHLLRKAQILDELLSAGRRLSPLVHPSSQVHPTCKLGHGCLIYPLCNIGAEVALATGALLNNSVVVSHDSHVEQAAYLSPGVVLSGHVAVGKAAFLGTGVLVANNRRVGNRARVGIGTTVTEDIPDDASAIGNPMRLLHRPLNLD